MCYLLCRYQHIDNRLLFLEDLELFDDMQLTLNLNSFMQPAVI